MREDVTARACENFATPFYLLDLEEFREQIRNLQAVLGEQIRLCYAVKANPFLIRTAAGEGLKLEVCSPGELAICERLGISMEQVVLSGVYKEESGILELIRKKNGKGVYTVESRAQFEMLVRGARQIFKTGQDGKLRLMLRLTSGNQFGMDKDLVQNLMQARELFSHVNIRGIHYFSGTCKKIEKICRELEQLDAFLLEAEEKTGCKAEELEYGPGLFAACFEGEEDRAAQELAAICEKISAMRWKGKVTLEMGRAFTASCGYYLTGVRDIKKNNGVNYCIVDGGIHQLQYDGQIRGMFRPGIRISPEHENEPARKWTVCGSLCTANDILIQNVTLQGLRQGNVLIFENAGAYSAMEGMALFLSHELPKIALYSQAEGWKLVRREKPTYEWNMAKEIGNENFDKYFNGH